MQILEWLLNKQYQQTASLKEGGHAKNVFLILVLNGQLKCEIMKYAFLKFFIP